MGTCGISILFILSAPMASLMSSISAYRRVPSKAIISISDLSLECHIHELKPNRYFQPYTFKDKMIIFESFAHFLILQILMESQTFKCSSQKPQSHSSLPPSLSNGM